MTNNATSRPWLRQYLPVTLAGVGIVVVIGAILLTRSGAWAGLSSKTPTFAAQRGPLTISVIESGTIKSQDQVVLKNEVEGQTTLIYLIPEGTRVEEGQLLAELDGSRLHDDRVEQQIRVENAEAEFIRARENLAVVKNQADSDTSKAELDYQFAQEDVTKYADGEYPQQLREAESKITIAGEEQQRAAEKVAWSERLYQEKYISQTELEADRLTHKRAELEYELAVAAKKLLEEYTHKREMAKLRSDVEQTQMALERTKLKANADIVQAEAQLKAKEAEFQQQQNKLTKLDDQIRMTKIVAPRAGLVVYATSTRGGRPGMTQPLEEGQTVRERQELIYLPSTGSMMAELLIHESTLEKVKPGQPVNITVDAMPGKTFAGHVRSIAPLPDAQSTWMNPDRKVFPTKVYLTGENPELRTGMSCRAEIFIQNLSDAVYVPVQAAVRVAGKPTVYVRNGDNFLPRTIEVGLDNSSMVHIVSGLEAGEVVSLVPPLDTGTAVRVAASPVPSTQAAPVEARGGPPEGAARAASQPGVPTPGSQPSEEDRAAMRERFRNMTPEEREAEIRKRMESMTPEQREEMMKRMRERQAGRGGEGARGGDAGERRPRRNPDGSEGQPGPDPGGSGRQP